MEKAPYEKLKINPEYEEVYKQWTKRFGCEPRSCGWLYGHYEKEAFLLLKMIREKNEAKLKVGYTKNLRIPFPVAYFKANMPDDASNKEFKFRACGNAEIYADATLIATIPQTNESRCVTLPKKRTKCLTVKLSVDDPETEVPAFLPLSFQLQPLEWLHSPDGVTFSEPAQHFSLLSGYPHESPLMPNLLTPQRISKDTWDVGCEVFGIVEIRNKTMPNMYIGESIEEAMNENAADEEQTREIVPAVDEGKNVWQSKVKLALRYVRVKNATPKTEVQVYALYWPMHLKGAFHTRNSRLNRIWSQSVYTLRLCSNHFLLDGIKRDRLPWAGDLAVSMMANAYSFGNAWLIKDSLSVLGATGIKKGHINTIPDYTMWWIICHDLYQLFFADKDFLRFEYPRIRETIDILLSKRDGNGFLTFEHDDWPFIDWVPGKKTTAVQILFFKALNAGAKLAKRMKDVQGKQLCEDAARKIKKNITALAFDKKRGLFVEEPGSNVYSRHANLLAVYAEIVSDKAAKKIAGELAKHEMPRVGTPYMSVFEAIALFKAGFQNDAMKIIEEIWGGMLDYGATSFFEGFNPDEKGVQHLVFYNRPYGKSLCHAWGAGPAFFLPKYMFGIEPLSDGWKKFKVQPYKKGLTGKIVIPVKECENIVIELKNGGTYVSTPGGCELVD